QNCRSPNHRKCELVQLTKSKPPERRSRERNKLRRKGSWRICSDRHYACLPRRVVASPGLHAVPPLVGRHLFHSLAADRIRDLLVVAVPLDRTTLWRWPTNASASSMVRFVVRDLLLFPIPQLVCADGVDSSGPALDEEDAPIRHERRRPRSRRC